MKGRRWVTSFYNLIKSGDAPECYEFALHTAANMSWEMKAAVSF
jgi:hypothetical protein